MDRQSNRSLVLGMYRVGGHLRLQAVSFEQIPLFTLRPVSPIHCSFPNKSSSLNIFIYATCAYMHLNEPLRVQDFLIFTYLIVLMFGTSK